MRQRESEWGLFVYFESGDINLFGKYGGIRKIGISEDVAGGIGIAALILLVIPAVALFITTGMKMEKYQYIDTEIIELEYGVTGIIKEEKTRVFGTLYNGNCNWCQSMHHINSSTYCEWGRLDFRITC